MVKTGGPLHSPRKDSGTIQATDAGQTGLCLVCFESVAEPLPLRPLSLPSYLPHCKMQPSPGNKPPAATSRFLPKQDIYPQKACSPKCDRPWLVTAG